MSHEALLRIEYKLDLLIAALQAAHIMLPASALPQMSGHGGPDDICPVCQHDIKLTIDFVNEQVTRSCGCRAPVKVVPGISKLLTSGRSNASGRTEEDQAVPPDQAPSGGRNR